MSGDPDDCSWLPTPEPQSPIVLGHRMWELLGAAVRLARAHGTDRMGVEHLLLTMLVDPTTIPSDQLRAMGLDPGVVFARLMASVPDLSGSDFN
ncbi:Clp protease N-terminal domain-containing protein [Nocardia sp. NPDC051030]|uniref:Clp protease N-terminal domain-containing protein n=1 Tax=Nocardia sp. NPDC051030 TaxID=3155162 RepID=UPI003426D9D2